MYLLCLILFIIPSACDGLSNHNETEARKDHEPEARKDAPKEQVETGHFKWHPTFDEIDLNKPETFGQKDFGAVGKLTELSSNIKRFGFGLDKYKMRSIKGDGSCWIRAIAQSLLYPVLHVEEDFALFIQRVKELRAEVAKLPVADQNLLTMLQQEPVDFAVKLFTKLKTSSDDQRNELYNYQKVDLFLDWFFRSVVALELFKEALNSVNDQSHRENALEALTHKRWGGYPAHNIALAKYFKTKLVSLRNDPLAGRKRALVNYGEKRSQDRNDSFAFLPATKYTQVISLVSSSHQEIIERVTPFRADRELINTAEFPCVALEYLLNDSEVDENSTYDSDNPNLGSNAGFMHLAAGHCGLALTNLLDNTPHKPALISAFAKKDSKGNTPWHYYALLNDDSDASVFVALMKFRTNYSVEFQIANSADELPIEMIFKSSRVSMGPIRWFIRTTPMSVVKKALIKQQIELWTKYKTADEKAELLKAVDSAPLL